MTDRNGLIYRCQHCKKRFARLSESACDHTSGYRMSIPAADYCDELERENAELTRDNQIKADRIKKDTEEYHEQRQMLAETNKERHAAMSENAELKKLVEILKTLSTVDKDELSGHECKAKQVLLSMKDRYNRATGKKR